GSTSRRPMSPTWSGRPPTAAANVGERTAGAIRMVSFEGVSGTYPVSFACRGRMGVLVAGRNRGYAHWSRVGTSQPRAPARVVHFSARFRTNLRPGTALGLPGQVRTASRQGRERDP